MRTTSRKLARPPRTRRCDSTRKHEGRPRGAWFLNTLRTGHAHSSSPEKTLQSWTPATRPDSDRAPKPRERDVIGPLEAKWT